MLSTSTYLNNSDQSCLHHQNPFREHGNSMCQLRYLKKTTHWFNYDVALKEGETLLNG